MQRRIPWFLMALAALAVAAPSKVEAAPVTLPYGEWQIFGWNGLGPIANPVDGYFLDAVGPTMLRVVDCCVSGDAFDIFVNGMLAFSTPSVPGGISTGALTGDVAWADARLSKGSMVLGTGQYFITIDVREINSGFPTGDGFIRADRHQQVVPEPISLALLGTGLAGVAVARRRRRQV